jgi:putative transposase
VRNHARSVLASDFFVVVTATFRVIYVFVVLEIGTRRILHWNVTEHPTADWTAQQFRMIVPGDQAHRFVIHDRDTIYSEGVDRTLAAMGLAILKTPARVPQANTFCERLIGTIRRECLDFVIPMTERHLRAILREWIRHYNRGRPHSSLGPGIPEGPRLNEHNGESGRHRLTRRTFRSFVNRDKDRRGSGGSVPFVCESGRIGITGVKCDLPGELVTEMAIERARTRL